MSPGPAGRNVFVFRQIVFVEADRRAHRKFRGISIAFHKANDSVRNAQATYDIHEHQIQNLTNRECLGARRGKKTEPAKLVVQLIGTSSGALQNEHDHRYAERYGQQMIKGDPQEE